MPIANEATLFDLMIGLYKVCFQATSVFEFRATRLCRWEWGLDILNCVRYLWGCFTWQNVLFLGVGNFTVCLWVIQENCLLLISCEMNSDSRPSGNIYD